MKQKNQIPAPKTMREEMLDAVFGTPDDIDEEAADAILEAHEIDIDALISGFQEKVARDSGRFISQSKPVPTLLKNAQRAMKENPSNKQRLQTPAEYIDKLLSGIGEGIGIFSEPVFSFKGRKDDNLAASDIEIIQSLEKELDEDESASQEK